jgi:uncharacterized membrane protein HdeD (DUF308 family)
MMKTAKKVKWTCIGISLILLLFGLCLVIFPSVSATVLCYMLGGLLLAAGIVRIVCYLRRGVWGFTYHYELPFGIIDLLAAAVLLLRPYEVLVLIPVVLGVMMIADSLFTLHLAVMFRQTGVRRSWDAFLCSFVNLGVGFLLLINPFHGSMALMTLIGVSLIVDSIQSLFIISYAVKNFKNVILPTLDYMDADYVEIEE